MSHLACLPQIPNFIIWRLTVWVNLIKINFIINNSPIFICVLIVYHSQATWLNLCLPTTFTNVCFMGNKVTSEQANSSSLPYFFQKSTKCQTILYSLYDSMHIYPYFAIEKLCQKVHNYLEMWWNLCCKLNKVAARRRMSCCIGYHK